jgi:hypothetical protein
MNNSIVTLEIIQHVDGLQVSNVLLTAEPGRLVNNRTACNIAANRMSKLINTIRTVKRSGANVGYKMNLRTTLKVWNGSKCILDTAEARDILFEAGIPHAFTFRGVTSCEKKRANVLGAFEVLAELNSVGA